MHGMQQQPAEASSQQQQQPAAALASMHTGTCICRYRSYIMHGQQLLANAGCCFYSL
jgi:hypothetical protein